MGATDTMELLTISSTERRYGIHSAEIKRVIMDLGETGRDAGAIDRAKESGQYFTLGSIFRFDEGKPDALLVISADNVAECVLGVHGTVDVVRIDAAQIIPVSEFVRKRQDPFFLWGIVRTDESPIILLTFCFLLEKGRP